MSQLLFPAVNLREIHRLTTQALGPQASRTVLANQAAITKTTTELRAHTRALVRETAALSVLGPARALERKRASDLLQLAEVQLAHPPAQAVLALQAVRTRRLAMLCRDMAGVYRTMRQLDARRWWVEITAPSVGYWWNGAVRGWTAEHAATLGRGRQLEHPDRRRPIERLPARQGLAKVWRLPHGHPVRRPDGDPPYTTRTAP
ncbi:hypothetical protein GCM10009716_10140 [Streptomyces sodiiphilus]|uniref:Uncharacterized protein n=1 Tax=Streptomyces sodiiphilus TaxID=226217 RepID=A0ABN2NXN7_9ACTN